MRCGTTTTSRRRWARARAVVLCERYSAKRPYRTPQRCRSRAARRAAAPCWCRALGVPNRCGEPVDSRTREPTVAAPPTRLNGLTRHEAGRLRRTLRVCPTADRQFQRSSLAPLGLRPGTGVRSRPAGRRLDFRFTTSSSGPSRESTPSMTSSSCVRTAMPGSLTGRSTGSPSGPTRRTFRCSPGGTATSSDESSSDSSRMGR